ncbi:hypothetical protein T4D_5963 [Trichinella pseudospiralis]|uniref:Uncharacterized protein n=1 Tax=Trichinella pseudospiralis TaxID=6337 RepID=A0A0V1G0C0_TRIPS|nr:hypothetical protein T4D_5963 [Trichinella pseudospiralis]
MEAKGEGYNIIQRPHLASVAVGHAMLHYMHNELVICQNNKISSFMLMLKVMKTQIEVTQLTLIARKLHRWSSQTRRLQRTMLLGVIDDTTLSHLLVPASLSDLNLSSGASNVTFNLRSPSPITNRSRHHHATPVTVAVSDLQAQTEGVLNSYQNFCLLLMLIRPKCPLLHSLLSSFFLENGTWTIEMGNTAAGK